MVVSEIRLLYRDEDTFTQKEGELFPMKILGLLIFISIVIIGYCVYNPMIC